MNKKIVVFLSALVVLAIGVFIGVYSNQEKDFSNATGVVVNDGVIPGYTAEQIQEMMQREADKSMFSFEINARPVFEDGESEGAIRIANPPYGAYAIEVEIKLDDSGETVFKTPFEINARPVFEDGESEGAIRIANPPYGAYAIEVEIKLDDSGETVFKTPRLQPNQYIEKAKLSEKLEAGEYPATATITAYDLETDDYVGMSSAKLIIKIEN